RPRIDELESRILPSTYTWNNSNGGDWDTVSNWTVNGAVATQLPGAGDDVVINALNPGSTVTHSTAAPDVVNSLSSQPSIVLSAGSSTIGSTSTIHNDLTLSNATLTGAGNLTVGGEFTWSGGTLGGNGGGSLTAAGGMAITGGTLDGYALTTQGT